MPIFTRTKVQLIKISKENLPLIFNNNEAALTHLLIQMLCQHPKEANFHKGFGPDSLITGIIILWFFNIVKLNSLDV